MDNGCLGFIVAYIIFTTILYFILLLTHKLPNWGYPGVMLIVACIAIAGIFLKRWLK